MKSLLFSFLLFFFINANAQYFKRLEEKLQQAKTPREKIVSLDSLATGYSLFYLNNIEKEMIIIIDETNNITNNFENRQNND